MNPLKLAQKAAKEIPAYRKFLNGRNLLVWDDIPITDKKNYIRKYASKDFFPGGRVPPFAYASSGSSGTPTLWFRSDRQEEIGAELHEPIVRDLFKIQKSEPTLAIISFHMGLWVAGNYTAAAFRGLARKGYQITTVTPGSELNDTLLVLKHLAPEFSHVILAGYPTALMNIFREAKQHNIRFPRRFHVISAGDKSPVKNFVNIYGSADAGMIAYNGHYNPKYFFFEEINGELLMTTNATATPLIRYNTHDLGRVFPGNRIELQGRTDVAVTFYNSYTYPWHLAKVLGNTDYFAYRKISPSGHDAFHIVVTKRLAPQELAKKLARVNIEYAKVLESLRAKALPRIHKVSDITAYHPPKGSEGVLSIRGKKPKMVTA